MVLGFEATFNNTLKRFTYTDLERYEIDSLVFEAFAKWGHFETRLNKSIEGNEFWDKDYIEEDSLDPGAWLQINEAYASGLDTVGREGVLTIIGKESKK